VSTSQTFRKFRLSPFGSQHGVSCDEHGAFVSGVPLLARTAGNDGHGEWKPRDIRELSADLSKRLGLPIDVSSKSKGIAALAEAFNNNADIARAQLNALHLQFPNSQPLPGSHGFSRENFVGFVRALDASGLIKADWNPDEHPRWPAGVPDSQGGQFAPKGEGGGNSEIAVADGQLDRNGVSMDFNPSAADRISGTSAPKPLALAPIAAVDHGDEHDQLLEEIAYQGDFHDDMVQTYAEYLRAAGFKVETELPIQMADGSAHTRIDVLARMAGVTVGVEVKTGKRPFPTLSQLLIYPHMIYGESVLSNNPRITTLGFEPGQLLPKIPVLVMYVRDPDSKPVFRNFDPEKMLEEYYRRIRGVRKSTGLTALLAVDEEI
jgi:hypothetical protein